MMQKMRKNNWLPNRTWAYYENIIKLSGENDNISSLDSSFLDSLGLVNDGTLSETGKRYFNFKFIELDEYHSRDILREVLVKYQPVEAIIQLLRNVAEIKKENILTVLKNRGFWADNTISHLVNFISLLNFSKIIVYSKKYGHIKIIYNFLDEGKTPTDIFIDPTTPYSNRILFKRILSGCKKYIYWLDKHFQKEGLEIIWESINSQSVKEIKIISIDLNPSLLKSSKKEYLRLKSEFNKKGINLFWFILDSKLIRDNHDRWILSEAKAWNVPPLNAIISGQMSEIHESDNNTEVLSAFSKYLSNSNEI